MDAKIWVAIIGACGMATVAAINCYMISQKIKTVKSSLDKYIFCKK